MTAQEIAEGKALLAAFDIRANYTTAGSLAEWLVDHAKPLLEAAEECERLRADAERYRWLRAHTFGTYGIDAKPAFVLPHVPTNRVNIMRGSVAGHLDAAIDAARSAHD